MALNFVAASSQNLSRGGAVVLASPVTFHAVIRPTTHAAVNDILSVDDGATALNAFLLRQDATGHIQALADSAGSFSSSVTAGTATNGAWAYAGAVFASSTSRTAYLNGTAATTDVVSITPGGTLANTHIGAAFSPQNFYNGDIAEVAIWSIALSAADMSALALGVSPLLIHPEALVSYWSLLNNGIELIKHADVTLNNGPTVVAHPPVYNPGKRNLPSTPPITQIAPWTQDVQGVRSIQAWSRSFLERSFKTQYYLRTPTAKTPPVATALSPSSDRTTGGSTIIIIGVNFVVGATVTFGGTPATGVVVSADSMRITCTVPAHAAGSTSVIVTNPSGDAAAVPVSFTYYALAANPTALIADFGGVAPFIERGTLSISQSASRGTAAFNITSDGIRPVPFIPVKFGIGSLADRDLIFRGKNQVTDQFQKELKTLQWWNGQAVDSSAEFNRRLVWGTYTTVPADVVALDLLARYAPDFTGLHITSGLAAVTQIYEGDSMDSAFNALATAIGGYYYRDETYDVHLYITEAPDLIPDALNNSNTSLLPGLTWTADVIQFRNKVIGVGANTTVLSSLNPGETIVPIADATIFDDAVNKVLIGAQQAAYTGRVLGGFGTLVGPGTSPPVGPTLSGAGAGSLGIGAYQYAFTDVTAVGESLPSPLSAVTTGVSSPPSSGPAAGTPTNGVGPDPGSHYYAVTFVTSSGETTVGPSGNAVVTTQSTEPSTPVALADNGVGGSLTAGTYGYAITFVNAVGETTGGTSAAAYATAGGRFTKVGGTGLQLGPVGTTARKIYRTVVGGAQLKLLTTIPNNSGSQTVNDGTADGSLGANIPTSNGTIIAVVPITAIPIGPGGTIARKLYGTAAGGSQLKFIATIGDNTTIIFSVTTPDSGLGANAPVSNTAVLSKITVSAIATGAPTVTQRNLYRTAVNAFQLKLLTTLADNVATMFTDSVVDGSLGANAPTSDTSGLQPTAGQVTVGSPTLLTASASVFTSSGWAICGSLLIRYGSISGNTLMGIPTSGLGSIKSTIPYGSQLVAAPLLVGVSGLNSVVPFNANVNLYTERNDVTSQNNVKAIEGGTSTGVYEFKIGPDSSLSTQTALNARCDADLILYASYTGVITVKYPTRDLKSHYGKSVHIDLPEMGLLGDFIIQSVNITNVDEADNTPPIFNVTASSVRLSLEDVLRHIVVTM